MSTEYYTEDSYIDTGLDYHTATLQRITQNTMRRCKNAAANGYTADDVFYIVNEYFNYSFTVIHPVIPIAQMLHETGNLTSWWCQRPRRNPAGIGVNGLQRTDKPKDTTNWHYDEKAKRWKYGIAFPTWSTAIEVHYGRLLAYCIPVDVRSTAEQFMIDRALSYRALPDKLHGSVTMLKELGRVHNKTGFGWASPGTNYGAAIAAIMNEIVA